MTSTINASTTAGIVTTADTSGVLALQTAGTTAVTVDASQNVGIGTASPQTKIDNTGSFRSTGVGDPTTGAGLELCYRGSVADVLSYNRSTSQFTELQVRGSPIAFLNAGGERARIDSSGNVLVTSAAGLGYGTGSGGTVTQATSKSTTVTLNKPTGQITMNNAALAASTNVSFQLTNSLIASTDTLICSITTAANYSYQIQTYCGAGIAQILLRNIDSVSRSEAIVINFAIIKGATS